MSDPSHTSHLISQSMGHSESSSSQTQTGDPQKRARSSSPSSTPPASKRLDIKLKLKRSPIACQPCREKKRRCDGERPSCLQCLQSQSNCVWPERDKRRKRTSVNPFPAAGAMDMRGFGAGPWDYRPGQVGSTGYGNAGSVNGMNGMGGDSSNRQGNPSVQAQHIPSGHLTDGGNNAQENGNENGELLVGYPMGDIDGANQLLRLNGFPSLGLQGRSSSFNRPSSSSTIIPNQPYNISNSSTSPTNLSTFAQPQLPSSSSLFHDNQSIQQLLSTQGGQVRPYNQLPSVAFAGVGDNYQRAGPSTEILGGMPWDRAVTAASHLPEVNSVRSTRFLEVDNHADDGMHQTGEQMENSSQFGQGTNAAEARANADVQITYEYLRPYGPTAIRPGLGRIRLSIKGNPRLNPQDNTPTSTGQFHNFIDTPGTSSSHHGPPEQPARPSVVDPVSGLPSSSLRATLLDIFFGRFGNLFPFLNRETIDSRIRDVESVLSGQGRQARVTSRGDDKGVVLLVNAMCALSARFCKLPDVENLSTSPFCRGIPFADNAKQLLIPLLGMPSANTTAALLFLSWYEFGMNSEAGLWAYSGMALRMAVDLGFNRRSASRMTTRSNRLLFWCIYLLDRTLAIGTGRPTTLPENQIDIPDPEDDMQDLASSRNIITFSNVIKLTRLYGKFVDIANQSPFWLSALSTGSAAPTRAHSPVDNGAGTDRFSQARPESLFPQSNAQRAELASLAKIEDSIMQSYENLPSTLVWSIDNLLTHIEEGRGEIFVHLHLWYYCILAILYREPLIQARAAHAGISIQEATQIQEAAARKIHEIVDAIPSRHQSILLNQPFINQCFYTAACTWIAELSRHSQDARTASKARNLVYSAAMSKFTAAAKILRFQSEVWAGVGWIAASLARRGAGLSLKEIVKGGTVDTIISEAELRLISSDNTVGDMESSPSILDLRESIWQSFQQAPNEFNDEAFNWGADGLFDEDMNKIFFGSLENSVMEGSNFGMGI